MEQDIWQEYEDIFVVDNEKTFNPKEKRTKKRKWREIESYKDRRRLRQELTELADYNLNS